MRTPVTCVVTAYNHERFVAEAVDSALHQDYPPELLDVVVVNDGSTDGTRAVLDARFGDEPRVTLIHQDNQGFVAAMNRAIGAATGELIAILDGDDTWPADKLRRQVAILDARPEVGLVHGDMEVVDADDQTLHPSFFAYSRFEVARGRILAKLIRQNFVAGGASVVRASLREHFHPIPAELIYPDWYIAARIAERAEIDHVDASVNRYRMHGANMGLGGGERKFFSDMRNNVRIQRWMLGNLDTTGEPAEELAGAAEQMVNRAARAALELDARPTQVLPVSDEQRAAAHARALAAHELFDAGRLDEAARECVRALALDPWNGGARADLAVAIARRERRPVGIETRGAAIIAFADELVAAPELLAAYARVVAADADVTLLIHAPAQDAQALAGPLGELAATLGDDSPDLLLFPSADVADVLAAPVRAVYSRRAKPGPLATLPRVDDTSVERLAALAAA
jgi:Glycosyl transferase family 2